MQMLEKKPEVRPASMEEVRERLRRLEISMEREAAFYDEAPTRYITMPPPAVETVPPPTLPPKRRSPLLMAALLGLLFGGALVLLILATGCSVPERAWLDLPGSEEAKSILIAVRAPDLRVFAYPIDREGAIELPILLEEGPAQIEVALFAEPLPLGPGEIERQTGGTIRQLPDLVGVYATSRRGKDFGEWTEAAGMSEELADFPIPPVLEQAPCGKLEGTRIFLPTTERAVFMLPLQEAVLIGTGDDRLFRVEDGSFQEIAVEPQVSLRAGAKDELGRLWFASTSSRSFTLWSGVLEGELALTQVASGAGELLRIAVSKTEPLEIVAIDKRGTWIGFDEALGVRVLRPTDFPDKSSKVADLEVLGPGHVVGVHTDLTDVYRLRNGVVEVEVLPALPDRLRGIGFVPGIGTLVTAFSQNVWRHDGDAWTVLGETALTLPPAEIVPIATGFLVGSDLGGVEEYRIGAGFCREMSLPSQGEATVLGAPLAGGAVFVNAYDRDEGELLVTLVKRSEP
jgi:hypothetical protein